MGPDKNQTLSLCVSSKFDFFSLCYRHRLIIEKKLFISYSTKMARKQTNQKNEKKIMKTFFKKWRKWFLQKTKWNENSMSLRN